MSADEDPNASTLRILVTTDNHVGYMERDPVRGNDTFVTMEEVFQIAKREKVDFILLGGDLFHDNKPSRKSVYNVMELIRRYTFGDGEVNFQVVSDQSANFHNRFARVNYEDPNYNIERPIFCIHGNHDDPTGDGGLSAMDILSIANMVNYFGKTESVDDITVVPLLLAKGSTKLAIYGMGNVRDERLNRTFQGGKVRLLRPKENQDEWFNVMMLHQNRVNHNPKQCIHEEQLDDFIDLVVWGHEHECLVTPVQSAVREFFITQPGSTVATSLCEAESRPKAVGILEVKGTSFQMREVPLKTVRPFLLEDINLSEAPEAQVDKGNEKSVSDFLAKKVRKMLAKLEREPRENINTPVKPLVRLRVELDESCVSCNAQRFGQQFVNEIANPDDILLFHRKKKATGEKKVKDVAIDMDLLDTHDADVEQVRIEDLVVQVLESHNYKLDILNEADLNEAITQYVDKKEKSAIQEFVKTTLDATQKALEKSGTERPVVEAELESMITAMAAVRNSKEGRKSRRARDGDVSEMDFEPSGARGGAGHDSEGMGPPASPPSSAVASKPARGKGAKAATAKATTKKTVKKKTTTRATRGRGGKKGGRGRAAESDEDEPPQPSEMHDDEDEPSHVVDDVEDDDDDAPRAKNRAPPRGRATGSKPASVVVDDDDDVPEADFTPASVVSRKRKRPLGGEGSSEGEEPPASRPATSTQGVSAKWGARKKQKT